LPFSRPSIGDSEITAVCDVLRSGWITTGVRNSEFEKKFSNYTGCSGSVGLCSATAGMHLLLSALGIGPKDEVITPSMTWVSTANLIVLAGAPADMDPIRAIAEGKGIFLAEDAAHALGTIYKGDPIGSKGTSIFSFHPIKNITAGEGGMFCSDDPSLLERIRRLKFHGLGLDAFDREMQGRSPHAQVFEPGFKYNLTDISAVLGLKQLERLGEFNRKRTELAMQYRERLSGIDEILPLSDPPYAMTHSWHLFIVRLDTEKAGISRDQFMNELKRRNIGTGLHFHAVHLHKYYEENSGDIIGVLLNRNNHNIGIPLREHISLSNFQFPLFNS
jgi:UDP-4-amino-4-deoxy-L-arabinose-oxoglutarate aminotransferase